MSLQLKDLAALDTPAAGADGRPMPLPIALIDEDPAQPRTDFDAETLQELASTIVLHGVCQPVSVRIHPEVPGRYMLNFGARRLRAARLAGKDEIPAFLADPGDGYEQVIENEQREALTPVDLARFVDRQLKAGDSLTEIARRLGKSRGYLTFVNALIDAPDWLIDLYRSGKCRGMTELYELRRLHESKPEAVERWAEGRDSISRTDLSAFKAKSSRTEEGLFAADPIGRVDARNRRTNSRQQEGAFHDAGRATGRRAGKHLVLEAVYRDSRVTIDLSEMPEADGTVFVREADGEKQVVPAAELRLLRITLRP